MPEFTNSEFPIAADPTIASTDTAPNAVPSSGKVEILGAIVGAQIEIERALADLARSGLATGDLTSQLGKLAQLQRDVTSAGPAALASLRAEAISTASNAQYLAQQTVQAAAAGNANPADVAERRAAARIALEAVQADLFGRKVLDPYLKFDSDEDERQYRERERLREEAIKREKAKRTPEGDANAVAIAGGQLADAKEHGADASPDFARLSNSLDAATANLPKPTIALDKSGLPANAPDKASVAPADDMSDALAALRSAGVKPNLVASADPAHGLSEGERSTESIGIKS